MMSALALYRHPRTDTARVTVYALVQAMRILGFGLRLDGCARCRGKAGAFFSVASGGTVCGACERQCPDAVPLPPAQFNALRTLSAARPRELLSPSDAEITASLLPLLVSYAQYHLDRVFKSASLLDAFSS